MASLVAIHRIGADCAAAMVQGNGLR